MLKIALNQFVMSSVADLLVVIDDENARQLLLRSETRRVFMVEHAEQRTKATDSVL